MITCDLFSPEEYMSNNDRYIAAGVSCLVVLIGVAWAGYPWVAEELNVIRQNNALAACKSETNNDLIIECIFRVLEKELSRGGVAAAMTAFQRAYQTHPAFVEAACHRQAHRVGDLVYYNLYLGVEDMDKIDFPQSTTACGYGLYHGLFEHLIQDHPDTEFVTRTCQYFTDRLGETMGHIRIMCYHGSGHGLMLAHMERVPKKEWGNVMAFVGEPLKQCDSLPEASERDLEQCKEGIFNVLNEWMMLDEYGFHFDRSRPFRLCDGIPESAMKACYYEMAMKLDGIAQLDVQALAALSEAAPRKEFSKMAFQVGVAGIIQNVLTKQDGYQKVLAACAKLEDPLRGDCIHSVIAGLFEHGEPLSEYKKALSACAEKVVIESDMETACYTAVAKRLRRFYSLERSTAVCEEFPRDRVEKCIAIIKQ